MVQKLLNPIWILRLSLIFLHECGIIFVEENFSFLGKCGFGEGMQMDDKNIFIDDIDKGKGFDWGKTSRDYAKYRDIYPEEFYRYIVNLGLCRSGQRCLDIGTGTGVLPRNMYRYGAAWIAADISENQIDEARKLAAESEMDIDFFVSDAQAIEYPDETFDVITACQCIWYLNHTVTSRSFARMLKKDGSFLILYMGWLPFEDEIAGKSEELILKYNPEWSGCGDTVHQVWVPEPYLKYFDIERQEEFKVDIPFTRESWNGRMRACRGTSASMRQDEFVSWENEHIKMLEEYPDNFSIKHYISVAWLRKNNGDV